MNWRERLATLFGVATSASLLAVPEEALASGAPQPLLEPKDKAGAELPVFSDPRTRAAVLQLARHNSHSSHSSHASHASGSGGGFHSSHYSGTIPAPISPPPPPPRPAPSTTSRPVSPLVTTPVPGAGAAAQDVKRPLSQADISEFVQQVQIGLLMKGFDPGPATGQLNDKTKSALKDYQRANGLSETGTLDQPTIATLGLTPR